MTRAQVVRGDSYQRQFLITMAAVLLLWLSASIVGAAEVSSPTDIDRVLRIESVQSEAGHVSGVIRNHSSQSVSDVRLLIQQTYLWPNERKPRGESPSQAVVRVIAGPIAPGDSVRFNEAVPTPQVARGSFEAHAQILGFRYQETGSRVSP
ncbi:MAG TPA: hypothetical protein VK714_05665 [Myxococcota bacterium]|nr:hypothetical protein [Myxococcota bacterium]